MNETTAPCGCCNGTGRVPVTGRYAETLAILRRQEAPISGAALAHLAKCSNEAMCNRLRGLERKGLVVGVRNGRERRWTAKPCA